MVITPDGKTTSFGILAGDTLAPFLFIVVLDYDLHLLLDNMNEKGLQIRTKGKSQTSQHLTDFADDLTLITEPRGSRFRR